MDPSVKPLLEILLTILNSIVNMLYYKTMANDSLVKLEEMNIVGNIQHLFNTTTTFNQQVW